MRAIVLALCCTIANAELPSGSQWLKVNDAVFYSRTLAPQKPTKNAPAIVLLSGPSGRWHSDSAWFALLQPMLAQHFKTVAIDRAGYGFGNAATSSYEAFGKALPALLQQLNHDSVVLLGFASANLAIAHYVNSTDAGKRLKGVLLIDPDALGPKTVEFYATQAQDFQNPALADYVRSGKYDERAAKTHTSERAEVENLVPPSLKVLMDWPFYDAMAAARTERERIVQRFAEIARYDTDVRNAAQINWPKALPTIVWDTDFETADIAREPDNKTLIAWHEDSIQWFSAQFGACHLRSESRQHLATFAEAEKLLEQAKLLADGKTCR
jgi:pimeloyl-ACP methyl ester carboxylesterase